MVNSIKQKARAVWATLQDERTSNCDGPRSYTLYFPSFWFRKVCNRWNEL